MKVCFIAGTLGRGGAERQLVFMLRALQLEGADTKLLCLTSGEALEKEIIDLGIGVEWVGSSSNRFIRLFRIIKAIREYKPDIIQSAHFYTNLYVGLAGRILGIRNIGAIRNDLSSEVGADPVFGKWQFRLPKCLVANSEYSKKAAILLDKGTRTIELVQNVVELPESVEGRKSFENSAARIIFVGRLVCQKRPGLFLELAGRLHNEILDIDMTFNIIGDGPLRPELEEQLYEMDNSNLKISFLGEQSEMSTIYREADILVSTSLHEGTPNVLLEAMAYGIPVIATRVGGVPELIGAGCGIIVDPSDFDGLVTATKDLIRDKSGRDILGRNGQAYVAESHSLGYLRKRLVEVHTRQLNSNKTND